MGASLSPSDDHYITLHYIILHYITLQLFAGDSPRDSGESWTLVTKPEPSPPPPSLCDINIPNCAYPRLYCTVLYSTVQYSTVQYSTVQYCTVQYSTVQYCTVLFVSSSVYPPLAKVP